MKHLSDCLQSDRAVRLMLMIILSLGPSLACADSYELLPVLATEEIEFGDLTIRKVYDGRLIEHNADPQWSIEVQRDDELIARISGVSFEDHAISPGASVFVGLSNKGIPDTAYIVFDSTGKLLSVKRHAFPIEAYCEFSVSVTREWYDGAQPDIRFSDTGSPSAESINGFSVRGCDGSRVEVRFQ